MLLSNLIEVEVEVEVDKIPFVNYSFILYIVCTGGGSWFHRIIVRGKNEYLYTFMFVLIV
jgi:hypothetical protein